MSSISDKGFLSEEAERYRTQFRATYEDQLSACEEMSHAATARLFNADLRELNLLEQRHIAVGIGLWIRCLRACQAALILAERGMVPEAQAQIRCAYEFLFYAAAVISDSDLLMSLESGDSYARREQAKAMLMEGQKYGACTEEQIASLNDVVAEHSDGKKQLSAYDAAKKVGMDFFTQQYIEACL